MKWIKIDGNLIEVMDISTQLSIGTHATIDIVVDISKNPKYYKFFINIYESRTSKFKLENGLMTAVGTRIKSVDIDFGKKICIKMVSDYIQFISTSENRDNIISDLLG